MNDYKWVLWLIGGVALGGVVKSCSDKPSSVSDASGYYSPVSGSGRPIGSRSTVNNLEVTIDYWNGVNGLPAKIAPYLQGGPEDQVMAFRSAARQIRTCPTLGVDPDLVNWSLRMATVLDQRADLIDTSRNPAMLAEAFIRGLNGDPLGVAIELNQAERAWVANWRAVVRDNDQLRATLTARYQFEFR